jgi:hypothetical protein
MKVRIRLSYYYTKHKAVGATLRLYQTMIYGHVSSIQGNDHRADFVVTLSAGRRVFTGSASGKVIFNNLPEHTKKEIMSKSKRLIASMRKRLKEGKPVKDWEEFVV